MLLLDPKYINYIILYALFMYDQINDCDCLAIVP